MKLGTLQLEGTTAKTTHMAPPMAPAHPQPWLRVLPGQTGLRVAHPAGYQVRTLLQRVDFASVPSSGESDSPASLLVSLAPGWLSKGPGASAGRHQACCCLYLLRLLGPGGSSGADTCLVLTRASGPPSMQQEKEKSPPYYFHLCPPLTGNLSLIMKIPASVLTNPSQAGAACPHRMSPAPCPPPAWPPLPLLAGRLLPDRATPVPGDQHARSWSGRAASPCFPSLQSLPLSPARPV